MRASRAAAPLTKIKVFYSADMVSDSGTSGSPSDRKPRLVHDALLGRGWPIEFVAPEPVSIDDICRVHDPGFVEEVLLLRRPNGFGSYSPSVARSLPYTSGAVLGSALVALAEGISASLTSGFHHAGPRGSRGFCTFNGLMIAAARLLATGGARRLAIVDCDFHYGDGTQAIIDHHQLADRVLHLSMGERFRRPEQARDYLRTLENLGERFASFQPDLLLYQAGADAHIDDPLGGLLTTDEMRRRDRLVLRVARELGIPITWNLAGGYKVAPDGGIPEVVELHLATFEEALQTWGLGPA